MPTQTWQRVRIIMLTTYDRDEQIFAALRMGASGYLVKDTGTENSCTRSRSWPSARHLPP